MWPEQAPGRRARLRRHPRLASGRAFREANGSAGSMGRRNSAFGHRRRPALYPLLWSPVT